jgi:hypothetical protein
MSLSLVAPNTTDGVPAELSTELRERRVERRVGIVWGLLILNALTFYAGFPLVIPIPHRIGEVITQGALPLALLVALTVNRRVIVRPNVFLCLLSLLILDAVLTTLPPSSIGTIYRTVRFAEFAAALWLISPWWGRRDLLLLRYHMMALWLLVSTSLLGLLVRPGAATAGGRLTNVFWPIPATEVGHYGAVLAGLMVVLWLGGLAPGRITLFAVVLSTAAIVLSHTRTALAGMVAGILIAGLSLYTAKGRVRKFFAAAAVMVSMVILTAASVVTNWLARGESSKELASLTGRTNFWELVLHLPRNKYQEIFGFGLSNTSINGLPIDSNWLAAYLQQGLLGVVVGATMLIFLFVVAFFQPPGIRRALALFLITYTLVASFTQVGFSNPTTYLLELTLAASLLVPSIAITQPE